MLETLAVVLPIFIVIAMGLLSASRGLLSEKVGEGLSEFVFMIAIPVLLFRTLATGLVLDVQPWYYWIAYFAGLTLVWLMAAVLVKKVFRMSGQEVAIAGFTTAQSNTVFVGIPLIIRAFGEAGAAPLSLLIAIHLPITMTVATLLVEKTEDDGGRWIAMLVRLFKHPILIGILAGSAYRLTGFGLPEAIDSTTRMIAGAAAPTALFALGMTLKRYGVGDDIGLVGMISFLKLVVHPALVYVFAFYLLPVPPVWAAVAVLFAACPSGVNAYLLAQRYQIGVGMASGSIAVSTLFAVGTVTFWLWLVSGVQ